MQVFAPFMVFEGILGGFLRRSHRRIELAKLVREAHADFKRVRHGFCWAGL